MSYRDEDDPFEEDIVFDQAGLLSTSRKSSKSAIRRVSSGKCAMFSKTLGLCGAFLGLGLTFAIPGPLSPVPPSELSHDKSLMTYEVMYRCQGFMIGAMFGARLLDRFNRLFLVFLALLVTALLVTIIPWCGNVWLLRTDMFLLGVSLGFLSTGGNVLCLDLWGRNSGPFMQALHFSYSLGVFLAPFLSQPLMTPMNYALVAPTTTPASMFPLHRLPRDLGSLSSPNTTAFAATAASSLQASSSSYHDLAFNKSKPVLSTASTTSAQVPSASTKTGVKDLKGLGLISPAPSSAVNLTKANATAPTVAPSSVPVSADPVKAANSTSSQGLSTKASTVSPAAIPVPALASEAVSPSKVDVATTTHRSPRPKPVLTNSEKLKDNKWENEKFRKPPPEDLVPVSTTMKPMVRVDNKTTASSNVSSSTTPPSVSNGNSTVKTSGITNNTRAANASELSKIFNGANGSAPTQSPSSAPSKAPLLKASSTVSPISSILSTSSVPLKINSSSVSNNSEAFPKVASSAVPATSDKDIHVSAVLPAKSGSTGAPIKGAQTKGDVEKHTTPSPSPLKAVLPTTAEKQVEPFFHSVVSKVLKDAPPLTMGKSTTNNSSKSSLSHGSSDSSSSASSVGTEKDSSSRSSYETSLPGIAKPKPENDSHFMGKSISLDEQDSTQNGPASSTSQPLQARISTPQPPKNPKPEREKTPTVNQKSFGGGHVKAMMEAKPLQVTTESTSLHNAKSTKAPEKMPEPKIKMNPTSSPTIPPLEKNLPGVVETVSHSESPAGPKHVHHSKPASTVVNDTAEVTHTVIDDVANRLEKYGLSRMELMYLTVGMVLLATSLLFLGFLCFNPRDPKSKTDEEDMNGHAGRVGPPRSRLSSGQSIVVPSRCLRLTLMGLMMVLLMITSGVQAMYGQLLLVYALQAPLQLSQSTGTAMTATFWGALTSTRFACILLASALSPTAMLCLSVAICSCATWLLSAFASSSEVALWIGSVMVSVGTASVVPSGMLWMQRHVLITHRVAAMLVMGPAMGEMFFPTLAYKMMVSLGPASLVHLPALLSLFAIAIWAAEWRLARYPRQPLCSHGDESSGYQLANQHDEDDLLDLTMSPIVNGTTAVLRNHSRSNASGLGVHRMSA